MLYTKSKKGTSNKNIIFIHGNSSSSRVFEEVMELSDLPYNLIALDLPGHGQSEHTGSYHWTNVLESLQETIDTIEGDKLLVGHSLGGHYAIELLPDTPSVKGILIFGTPPLKKPLNIEEAFIPNAKFSNFYLEKPDAKALDATLDEAITNKDVINLINEDFWQTDPKTRTVLGAELGLTSPPLKDQVTIFNNSSIKKYVLLTENDPLINQSYINQLQKEATNPFKVFNVKNCGHYPSVERSERFYSILKEAVTEVFES